MKRLILFILCLCSTTAYALSIRTNGPGNQVTTGSGTGTTNTVSKFTSGQVVGNSSATDDGTTFAVADGTMTHAGPYFAVGVSTFIVTNGRVLMRGTVYGDSAPAGDVGEILTATLAGDQTPAASGNYVIISTISLTAGDWDVYATAALNTGGTSAGTQLFATINTSGASNNTVACRVIQGYTWLASNATWVPFGPCRINVSTTTTYYLAAGGTYTVLGGAVWASAGSGITARRMR